MIDRGGFGTVFKGTFTDENGTEHDSAIKQIRTERKEKFEDDIDCVKAFERELEAMQYISELRCPHIVKYFGTANGKEEDDQGDSRFIALEYLGDGNVKAEILEDESGKK